MARRVYPQQSSGIEALATSTVDVKPLLGEAYPLTELEQGMKAFLSGEVLKNLIVPVEGLGVRG